MLLPRNKTILPSRDFGMADIVHCSAMERFGANMPVLAGIQLRSHSRYPNISRWYSAMDTRPAYQKVKSDDTTLNLVIRSAMSRRCLTTKLYTRAELVGQGL